VGGWAGWALVVVAWALVAMIFAVSSSLTFMLAYQPPQWSRTIASALADWAPWVLLTPVVVWLGRRFRLRRGRWVARALTLTLIGLPLAFIKLTLTQAMRKSSGVVEYLAITNFTTQYLIYWGLVVATHVAAHYREARDRELRASQLEASLADARLQLLKMQLQPHFLFNTLNTIAELVHENPSEAERMIAGLGTLLRETLEGGLTDLVPLAKELELLERYVAIQRVRFGDRLRVTIDVPNDARQALVPSLVLQPLIENAIKYGLAARLGAGAIGVRAERRGEALTIEVADDGQGFAPGEMREGVGLGNTRARLAELYGNHQKCEVMSAAGAGTRVQLTMPFRTAPHGDTV
jgi:two-component system LytT family sensor kinase